MQQCRDVHPAFNEFLGITIAVKLHYFEFDFCLVCCEARPLSPTRGPPVKKATKLEAKDEDPADGQEQEEEEEEEEGSWTNWLMTGGEQEKGGGKEGGKAVLVVERGPAPWASAKGHLANSSRPQKVPGRSWITEDGEKVWTHEESGKTFANFGFIMCHFFLVAARCG